MAGLISLLILTTLLQTNTSIEDVERRLGPFTVSGESYTVILHSKRLTAASDARFSETLAVLEIHDRTGAVAYQKAFPYELNGGRFSQIISASARLLPAEALAGLLVEYRKDPAAPGSEQYWQVFRFRNGKLGLFDVLPTQPPQGSFFGAAAVGRNGAQPIAISRGEMSEIKVWTGNFYATIPIRIDWMQGRVMPGQPCFELLGGSMVEKGCDLRAEAQRKPIESDVGFVRLFHDANENMGTPRHVVFKKDSNIELFGAKAITKLQVMDDLLQIRLSDVWLKVLIGDSEENLGWIHSDEDFSAVGLPSGNVMP